MGCRQPADNFDELQFQQQLDSMAGASIDSAYKLIQAECDAKSKARLPVIIDSILNP